jgi:hypothetical protein
MSTIPAQRRRRNGAPDELPLATIAHQERYSDAGNARRLVRLFGDDIRWVPEIGWHWFDGVRWRRDDDGEIERKAKQVPPAIISGSEHYPREMREEAVKFALRSEQAPRLQAMIDLARSEPGIHLARNALDLDPWSGTFPHGLGHNQPLRFLPESGRSPAIAGHERKDSR